MTDELTLLSRHRADSIVAWERGRTTSAVELSGHVAGLAQLLPQAGVEEEIVVVCRDRYRFAVSVLAAWRRGFSVALPPNAQPEMIRAMRERPKVRTVVHDVDAAPGIDVRDRTVVSAARERVGLERVEPWVFAPNTLLATVYTSGSTGEHAACLKTAGQLLGEAWTLAETFDIEPGSRVLAMVPPHHIYGLLFGVLLPLVSGGAIYRHTPLLAPEVAAALETERVDVLVTVPAHLRALGLAPEKQPSVPRIFSSSAPLVPEVATRVRERFGWKVTEVFGSTETGGIGWRDTGGEGPWTPFPGVEVGASDDGTLLLHSPFLHPDTPRPFVGADRVSIGDDGRFSHGGRSDGVLKIGGVRVSVAEVERRLAAIEGVHDATVMAVRVGGARGYELWAAVVAPELDVAAIRRALRRWIAPLAMPRRIKRVEALPREANGKLPRASLERLFGSRSR